MQNYLDDQCSQEQVWLVMIISDKSSDKIFKRKSYPKKMKSWIFVGKNVLVLEDFIKITQCEWNEMLNIEMEQRNKCFVKILNKIVHHQFTDVWVRWFSPSSQKNDSGS